MTKTNAKTKLAQCHGCTKDCNSCMEINSVIDSLMSIYAHEISATEDAEEMEIERQLAG